MTALECGHPTECLSWNAELEKDVCGWCESDRRVKALVECLNKQAFVVHDGGRLICGGPVGYLAVYGGEVNVGPGNTIGGLAMIEGG